MPIRSNISMVGNESSSPGYWNVRFLSETRTELLASFVKGGKDE
jgi:hypothetical protein